MPRNRRQILKTVGAAGVGSLVTIGSVSGDEGHGKNCKETVQTVTRSETDIPIVSGFADTPKTPVAVGAGAVSLRYDTAPFTLDDKVFESAEIEGAENRLRTVVTWNPTDQGPTECYLALRRRTLSGEWQVINRQQSRFPGVTTNRREMVTENGGTFQVEAENETTEPRENPVVVEGGQQYRVSVWASAGPVNFEVTAEAQAYDPECFEDDEQAN
jgi:hypothetical protein